MSLSPMENNGSLDSSTYHDWSAYPPITYPPPLEIAGLMIRAYAAVLVEFVLLQCTNIDPPRKGLENNPYPSQLFPTKSMSLCWRFNNPFVHTISSWFDPTMYFGWMSFCQKYFQTEKSPKKRHQQTDLNRFLSRYVSTQQLLVASVAQGLQHSKWHLLAVGSRC